jgi:hypothetical protein
MPLCHVASITLEGDDVVYFGPEGATWRLPLREIKVIAEFTTESFGEGHFVALIADPENGRFEAPGSSIGLSELLAELSGRLGGQIELRLARCPTRTSRVMWPSELAGQEMSPGLRRADAEPSG